MGSGGERGVQVGGVVQVGVFGGCLLSWGSSAGGGRGIGFRWGVVEVGVRFRWGRGVQFRGCSGGLGCSGAGVQVGVAQVAGAQLGGGGSSVGCSGGGRVWVQVGRGVSVGGGGGIQWGRGAEGQTLGGRELNGIFLQFELRFRNGLGPTLALQSFRIFHLINAEILAKNCTTRETKIKRKQSNLIMLQKPL